MCTFQETTMGIEASKQTGIIGRILFAAALTHEFSWGTATFIVRNIKEVSLLIWWFHQIYVDQQTCEFSYSKTAKRFDCLAFMDSCTLALSYPATLFFFPWFFFCAGYLISPLMLLVIEPTQTAAFRGFTEMIEPFFLSILTNGDEVTTNSWGLCHTVSLLSWWRLLTSCCVSLFCWKTPWTTATWWFKHPCWCHQAWKTGNHRIAIPPAVSRISDSGILGSFFTYGTRGNRCPRRFHVLTGEEILRKLSQYPESLELGAESLSGALLWQWGFTNHWAHKS